MDEEADEIGAGAEEQVFFGVDLTTLKNYKREAKLGYMKMNLVNPPSGAFWGKFNNRAVSEEWVQSLHNSFVKEMDNCADDHSIDVVLDPAWLANPDALLQSIDGMKIEDVPEISFTGTGAAMIKKNNLWMLSGNHRRFALARYIKTLKDNLDVANETIAEIIGNKSPDQVANLGEGPMVRLKGAQKNRKRFEARLKTCSFWTIRVYDRGACLGFGGPWPECLTRRRFSPDRGATPGRGMYDIQIHFEKHHHGNTYCYGRGAASGDPGRNEGSPGSGYKGKERGADGRRGRRLQPQVSEVSGDDRDQGG